jgi:hypothetical protein
MKHNITLDGVKYTLDADAAEKAGILVKEKIGIDTVKQGDVFTFGCTISDSFVYWIALTVSVGNVKVLRIDRDANQSVEILDKDQYSHYSVKFLTLTKNGFGFKK